MFVTRALVAVLVLGLMSGCDNSPNPNFQNALDAQAAAKAGDPYADLDNDDRRWGLRNYSSQEPAKQLGYAQKTAVGIQGSYSGLLSKLADDKKILGAKALYAFCRPKFDAANTLANADSITAAARSAQAQQLFAGLGQCRDKAIDAEEHGDSDAGPVIKRFASVGMVLVGASTVAKGDRAAGEQLWKRASKLADDDTPGFQIKLDNFR
ncbi:hypothetical protein [Sphingomonas sp.]|uniref:hypothetical protein n=1 Tax=Sphingomonas sp. TaxID=28214 RepID=UPI0025D7ED1E|nr:hypothetical protein [Sphingomonas sp.]